MKIALAVANGKPPFGWSAPLSLSSYRTSKFEYNKKNKIPLNHIYDTIT